MPDENGKEFEFPIINMAGNPVELRLQAGARWVISLIITENTLKATAIAN